MKTTVENGKLIKIPPEAKVKFRTVATNIKDKDLFQNKINAAKKSLQGLKSLPV
ncbi:hypothetical protein [uncultured Chryseobacterium sp.]|uniref:hypothetical protein n=1 Tax=uncultured Chryseobacterium sp. TaxID=259322 RepID=UPI0025CE3536|nr:hypothetical protein [uncultured Chryseobacterium sp.]